MFQNHPRQYQDYEICPIPNKQDVEVWFQLKCRKHVFKQTWHIKLLH